MMKNNYHEFKNGVEIYDWMHRNYEDFLDDIHKNSNTDNTLGNSLFYYTGSMSKTYNCILKFNDGSLSNIDETIKKYYAIDRVDKETKYDIETIYNAFSLNEIADDIVLFHYFDINYLEIELSVGSVFHINHFISTTLLRNNYDIKSLIYEKNYNSMLIIKVKKGVPCIPINNNPNSCLKEYEIILKPKSKFKIIKIRKKYLSKIRNIIECELIID